MRSSGSRPGEDLYAGNLQPNKIVPPRIESTQMKPAIAATTGLNSYMCSPKNKLAPVALAAT